jgi:hypothetical protein
LFCYFSAVNFVVLTLFSTPLFRWDAGLTPLPRPATGLRIPGPPQQGHTFTEDLGKSNNSSDNKYNNKIWFILQQIRKPNMIHRTTKYENQIWLIVKRIREKNMICFTSMYMIFTGKPCIFNYFILIHLCSFIISLWLVFMLYR